MITGAMLADTILPMTNQFGDFPDARRTGDFLYSTARNLDRSRTYKVVVNSFAAHNAANLHEYFVNSRTSPLSRFQRFNSNRR